MRMAAIVAHVMDEAMVFSQSLARRRHRPSHAKVRSTIHRRGEKLEALYLVRSLDDLDRPGSRSDEGSTAFVAGIASIGKDVA
jgi:hypothetical protein